MEVKATQESYFLNDCAFYGYFRTTKCIEWFTLNLMGLPKKLETATHFFNNQNKFSNMNAVEGIQKVKFSMAQFERSRWCM